MLATIYVVVVLVSRVVDRISASSEELSLIDAISIGLFPVAVWTLYRIQAAANIACDDPHATSNDKFTPANFIWLAIGAVIWGLVFFGVYVELAEAA